MLNQSTLLYVCQQILDLELKFNYILWDTVGCSQQKVRLGEYSATHFTIFLMYSVLLKAISEGTIQNNLYLNLKKSYILCIYMYCQARTDGPRQARARTCTGGQWRAGGRGGAQQATQAHGTGQGNHGPQAGARGRPTHQSNE